MVVVGLVGGVASGKSTVADELAQLGAEVIRADRIGHEVLQEPDVKQALRDRWGETVLDGQGEIDRSAVAARVFAPPPDGPEQRAYLEQITHPRIHAHVRRLLDRLAQRRQTTVVVLDAPVLLEAGWDALCDRIIFVEATDDLRRQRARQRGWTDNQLAAREAAQLPLSHKRARADWVIDNSGSRQATARQVQAIWRELIGQPASDDAGLGGS